MIGEDIQATAFADFDLWISFQDEMTQNLPGDDQAALFAADVAWHEAVDQCEAVPDKERDDA